MGIKVQEQGSRNTNLLEQFGATLLGGVNRFIDAEISERFVDRTDEIGHTADFNNPTQIRPDNQTNTAGLADALQMSQMKMIGAAVVVTALLFALLK